MKRWQTPALQNAVGKVKEATYDAVGVTGILWQKHRPTSAVGYMVRLLPLIGNMCARHAPERCL
jgi:hypothetical protein